MDTRRALLACGIIMQQRGRAKKVDLNFRSLSGLTEKVAEKLDRLRKMCLVASVSAFSATGDTTGVDAGEPADASGDFIHMMLSVLSVLRFPMLVTVRLPQHLPAWRG